MNKIKAGVKIGVGLGGVSVAAIGATEAGVAAMVTVTGGVAALLLVGGYLVYKGMKKGKVKEIPNK